MKTEGERLKALRKKLNIRQGDFAEKISTTQGHISDIENGRKNLSDRTIQLICLKTWDGKTVNEEWLRTGTGEMFIEVPEEDRYSKAAASLLKEDDVLGMEGLILYYGLSPELKRAAEDHILMLADRIRERRSKKEE